MELSLICIKQIVIMFILVAVGFLCGKTSIIDKNTNARLSRFVLDVVNPVLIFMSYQREYDPALMKGLLLSIVLGLCSFLLIMAVLKIIYFKNKSDGALIVRFASIYSNCAFMGIPLINGLFGGEGVLYITGYLTVFNIFVWTHGVAVFGCKKEISPKKIITSPSIIAIALGMISFVTGFTLPQIVSEAGTHIAGMNTPLAMICAGVTIAFTDIKKEIRSKEVYAALLLRLIVCPGLFFLVFRFLPIDIPETVFMTVLVASGCPAAATGTMFALRFEKKPELSAVIFAATTLLSCLTLPLVVMVGTMFRQT